MKSEPKRILLVEDNPGDIHLTSTAFAKIASREFELEPVESVWHALELLGERPFDSILLDLYLPDASGLDAVQKIHLAHPSIPIIVLTGFMDERLAPTALQMGAAGYFSKNEVDWEK